MKHKIETLTDQYQYVTDRSFTFSLDDGKRRQFGILFEVLNMSEATGEKEYKQYPFLVSASIIADKCHKSFDETDGHPDRLSLIYDCNSYMGGVPVDHVLTHAIKCAGEPTKGDAWESLTKLFSSGEAMVRTECAQYGTIAAQKGKNAEHSWFQFKTEDAAIKFINYLVEYRISALTVMIGFILDKPINMMGESGWSVIEKQVKGCKSNRKVGAS